jgi:type I restriction enzyme S subunit
VSGNVKVEPDEASPEARAEASLADAQAGRLTRHASVQALMEHLDGEQETVGWVPPDGDKRPEAVTRHQEMVGYAAQTHPTCWNTEKLAKLTTKVGSGSTPRGGKDAYHSSGVPLIRSLNVHFDGFRFEGLAYLNHEQANALKAVEVRARDVLLNITGASIGRVSLAPMAMDGARVNQHVCIVRPIEALDPSYLRWYLASPQTQDFILNIQSGATRQALTKEKILDFDVPLPPLDQQKRIVAEIEKQFSRLDEAVANLKRVKANLKRYKAAVLRAAVEGRLVETEAERARRKTPSPLAGEGGGEGARSYETGEQLLQRILETRRSQWFIPGRGQGKGKYKEPAAPDTTDLPELPEGWVWATYAQIGEVTTGFTPPTADPENFGGDIPFFKPTDLDAGESVVLAREHLSEKGAAKGRLLPAGSVLVTCIGATIGKTGLARVNCTTNQQINAVTPDGSLVNSEFVYAWTVSPSGYKQILDNSSATTLPILNKSKFEALGIPLPPLAEQHRIVAEVDRRLSLLRVTEAQVDANLRRAEHLRQSILSQAFAGG